MSFSKELARLQEERGESNYKLAKEIGVHQSSIANWKNESCFPHPRHVKKVADHFRCTVDELLRTDELKKEDA